METGEYILFLWGPVARPVAGPVARPVAGPVAGPVGQCAGGPVGCGPVGRWSGGPGRWAGPVGRWVGGLVGINVSFCREGEAVTN